jgi:hypothetical protein
MRTSRKFVVILTSFLCANKLYSVVHQRVLTPCQEKDLFGFLKKCKIWHQKFKSQKCLIP